MPLKDPEANRAYWKAYHIAHAEANCKRAKDWYEANKHDPEVRARRAAYNEKWKAENREHHLAAVRRRKRAAMADPVRAARVRLATRTAWRRRTAVLKGIVAEAKAAGCSQCTETDPTCLDFHHRDPTTKSFTIGKAIQRSVRPEVLRAEIAKCDVLCSNCHLKHEASLRPGRQFRMPSESERDAERRREKETRWEPLLARAWTDGCTLCPEAGHPSCLVFHHVDPARKRFMVMQYRNCALRGPVVEEMWKCIVLCENCHRGVHNGGLALPQIDLDVYWRERLA